MELTTEQLNIVRWIEKYQDEKGFPPCRRDIERKFEIGGHLVQKRLREIELAGYIKVTPGLHRGIRLVKGVEA